MATHKNLIFALYDPKQQSFLDFVLGHYIKEGVGELDESKLPQLLTLKYHAVADAVDVLGNISKIRDMFIGFREHLYSPQTAA